MSFEYVKKYISIIIKKNPGILFACFYISLISNKNDKIKYNKID